tara:strand:- start:34 stop:252 length:219 start_codon:yes stop_codon:yes gene_type:complete
MNNKYRVKDIIEAIDSFLEDEKKTLKLVNQIESPKTEVLKLVNEIEDTEKKVNKIPKDTEKIILQAEKYLKK